MNETPLPKQLVHRDLDRIKGYKELLDFYHGYHWEGRERRRDKQLTFNYAKVFIDKVTSYLMSGTNFAINPLEDSEEKREGAKRAEQALYEVYEANHLEQLDLETEIDCAILGDACFKIIWDAETKRVRVTAPDILGYSSGWKRALATVGTAIQGRLVAGEDGSSGDEITAYRRAVVSDYSGGTAGSAVYVAEETSYGKITETKPSTSGDCDTIIGYMVSATLAALEPGSRADSTAA